MFCVSQFFMLHLNKEKIVVQNQPSLISVGRNLGVTPLEYTGPHRTSVRLNSHTPRELAVPNLTGKRLNNITPSEYVVRVLLVVIDLIHPLSPRLKIWTIVSSKC